MKGLTRHILIGFAILLIAACSSAPVVAPGDLAARESAAAAALERGDYVRARDLYGELAAAATGAQESRYELAIARVEIAFGDPAAALAVLDRIVPLPAALESEATAIRAEAWFALGRTVEAVRLLVDRDILLNTPAEVIENQNLIWQGLSLPASQAAANTRTGDPTVDGWLALIPLTRLQNDSAGFMAGLLEWSETFGRHPAAAGLLAARVAELRPSGARPERIALLLPLTSELRPQALAVRDGIVAAHYASGRLDETELRIYDTASQGAVESYVAAQIEGAGFIIGPLLDSEVAQVRAQAGFIPTLALNVSAGSAPGAQGAAGAAGVMGTAGGIGTVDAAGVSGAGGVSGAAGVATNFYQYALSSDDEIQAIATRAVAAGHRTAVVLHQSTDYGYRIMNAFRVAFESRGGRVLGTAGYATDFAGPIDNLLNITESQQRSQTLRDNLATIGRSAVIEPRRREDVDMIFVQARPADGRLLMPLLRDKGAADIPTYALTEVHDPTRTGGDNDLNGLVFPDVPLLIDPEDAGPAASAISRYSSGSVERYPRFFAFGFDAYRLAESLYGRGAAAGWLLDGATGELHLEPDGRIRRVLPFARFSGGRPELVDPEIGTFGAR